ncbi:hypothetical protein os4_03580 [Comamonadaceae bacterium OS-4]|nr:hypothetical protein os4_03580 [Comamonadaceae bacterium OS-4]
MENRWVRWIRHRWLDDAALRLPHGIVERLAEGIRRCEQGHSAEVCLHIESSLPTSYLWRKQDISSLLQLRAKDLFASKGIWDTDANNGLLIYLCLAERSVELVFDRAVRQAIDAAQWETMLSRMTQHVRSSDIEAGMLELLDAMSILLAEHFPPSPGANLTNEISDIPTLQ